MSAVALQDRDYQTACVEHAFQFLSTHGYAKDGTIEAANPLLVLPTGTGKSVVIARLLQRFFQVHAQTRVMVLTHVKELIQQNYDKTLAVWPGAPAGIYSAGLGRKESIFPITFAGIGSVAKKHAHFGRIDIVIVDECHLVNTSGATMYATFIAALKAVNPHLRVIGLTATPWRIGQGRITDDGLFTHTAFDLSTMDAFNWLLGQGYLCRLSPRCTEVVLDVSGVGTQGGEFKQGELEAAVDKHETTLAALQESIQLANTGRKRYSWLIFCAGVNHALHTAEILRSLGVSCKAVHSDLPTTKDKAGKTERDRILEDWKAGRIQAVTNNNVLTTGIDHPALDLIIMLRPTHSTVLWIQMLGRGTRPFFAPGYNILTVEGRLSAIAASHKPDCLVLDFARNTERLGPINDPVLPRKKGEKKGEAPVKKCPICEIYNHTLAKECIACGHLFPQYGPAIANTSGTAALIREPEPPDVQIVPVTHITYRQHHKAGSAPSLRVTYYCHMTRYTEFVSFEHTSAFVRSLAAQWWRLRQPGQTAGPVPTTTWEAGQLTDHLRAPSHLRVWANKKPYPQIMDASFDGTAFGTIDAPDVMPEVQITNYTKEDAPPDGAVNEGHAKPVDDYVLPDAKGKGALVKPGTVDWNDLDDDIPF